MLNVEVDLIGDLGTLASRFGGLSEVDESEGQDDQHGEEDALNARHSEWSSDCNCQWVMQLHLVAEVKKKRGTRQLAKGGMEGTEGVGPCSSSMLAYFTVLR